MNLFTQQVDLYLTGELKGEAMTLAQAFEKRGLEKGMQQGMQQGEAALLIRQIQRRFGDIQNVYVQKIHQADAQTLLVWGERILDAATLDEIFVNPDSKIIE